MKPTTTLLQTESTEKSVAIDVATKLLTLPVTTQSQTESAQKTKPTTTPSTETTVTTEANAISSTRRQPSESKAKITQTRSTQRKSGFASVQPTVERNGGAFIKLFLMLVYSKLQRLPLILRFVFAMMYAMQFEW